MDELSLTVAHFSVEENPFICIFKNIFKTFDAVKIYFIAISFGGNLGRKLEHIYTAYGRLLCNYVYTLLLLCEIVIHSFMHNIYTVLMSFDSGTF